MSKFHIIGQHHSNYQNFQPRVTFLHLSIQEGEAEGASAVIFREGEAWGSSAGILQAGEAGWC